MTRNVPNDPETQGYSAFKVSGLSLTANPHQRGTAEHADWLKGWLAASDDHDRIKYQRRG